MPGKIYEELLNQAIIATNFNDKIRHKCLMCKNLLEFALEIVVATRILKGIRRNI